MAFPKRKNWACSSEATARHLAYHTPSRSFIARSIGYRAGIVCRLNEPKTLTNRRPLSERIRIESPEKGLAILELHCLVRTGVTDERIVCWQTAAALGEVVTSSTSSIPAPKRDPISQNAVRRGQSKEISTQSIPDAHSVAFCRESAALWNSIVRKDAKTGRSGCERHGTPAHGHPPRDRLQSR